MMLSMSDTYVTRKTRANGGRLQECYCLILSTIKECRVGMVTADMWVRVFPKVDPQWLNMSEHQSSLQSEEEGEAVGLGPLRKTLAHDPALNVSLPSPPGDK